LIYKIQEYPYQNKTDIIAHGFKNFVVSINTSEKLDL